MFERDNCTGAATSFLVDISLGLRMSSKTVSQRLFKNGSTNATPNVPPPASQNAAYLAALNAQQIANQQKSTSSSELQSLGQIAQTAQGIWDKTDPTKPFGARVAQLLKQNVPGLATGLSAYKTVKNLASVASPEGLKTLAEKNLPEPLKPYAGLIQNPRDIYNMVKSPTFDAQGQPLDVNAKAKQFAGKVIDSITPQLPYVKDLPPEHQALLNQALKGDTQGIQRTLIGKASEVAEQRYGQELTKARDIQNQIQSTHAALTKLQNTDPQGYLDKLNAQGLAQFPPDEGNVLRKLLDENPGAQSIFQKAKAFHSIVTAPGQTPEERLQGLVASHTIDDATHAQLLANLQQGQDLASAQNAKLVTESLTNHLLNDDNSPLKDLANKQDLVNHPATQILLNHLSTGTSIADAAKQHFQQSLTDAIPDENGRAIVNAALNPEQALASLKSRDPTQGVDVAAAIGKQLALPQELQEASQGNLAPAKQKAAEAAAQYLNDSGVLGKSAAAKEHAANLQNLYQSATSLEDTPESRKALASASVQIGKGLLTEAATHLPDAAVKPTQAGLGFVFDQAEKAANGEKPSSGLSFSTVGATLKKEATRQAQSFSDELFGKDPSTTPSKTSRPSNVAKAIPPQGSNTAVNVPLPIQQQSGLVDALHETLDEHAVDSPPSTSADLTRKQFGPAPTVNPTPSGKADIPLTDFAAGNLEDFRAKHSSLPDLPPAENLEDLTPEQIPQPRSAKRASTYAPPPRDSTLYDLTNEFSDNPTYTPQEDRESSIPEPTAKRLKEEVLNPSLGIPASTLSSTQGGSLRPKTTSTYRSSGSVPIPSPVKAPIVAPPAPTPSLPDSTPTFSAATNSSFTDPLYNVADAPNVSGETAAAISSSLSAPSVSTPFSSSRSSVPNTTSSSSTSASNSTPNAAFTSATNADQRQEFDQSVKTAEASDVSQASQAAANLKSAGGLAGEPESKPGGSENQGGDDDDEEDDDEEAGLGAGELGTSEFDPVNAVLGAISLGSSIKSLLDDEQSTPPTPDLPPTSGPEFQDQGISGPSSPVIGGEGSFFSGSAMDASAQDLDPSAAQSNLTNDLDAGL